MTNFNFLSKSGGQSMGHSSVTLASTVGSPSVHRRGAMLKLLSVLVLVLTFGVGNVLGVDYTLTTSLTEGDYVIGAVKGSAGTDTHIYAFTNTDNSSWAPGTETTPSGGKISDPSSSIVWHLTPIGNNGFSLKNGTKYLTIGTGTGSVIRYNSTSSGTIYFASTGSNSTFEISGASSFTVPSGNQVGYNIGNGYRQYAQRTHSTNTSSGQISVQFRFYKKVESCTNPTTLLSISSSNTATLGTNKTLTTSGGNNGTVTWTVANGTGSATVSDNILTPTSAGTVTVTATQDDNGGKCGKVVNQTITISKASATITLSEAGATRSVSGTHYGGDSYSLPTTTTASCGDKVLVGWSKVEVAETDTKPTSNYYDKGTSITLTAGENKFYAVFATVSSGSGSTTATISQTALKNGISGTQAYGDDASPLDDNQGNTWTIKANSQVTGNYRYIQMRIYNNNNGVSYIQLPDVSGNISSITLTVSSTSGNTPSAGSNTSTLYLCADAAANVTSPLASGTGASSITLTPSSNITTGYIKSGGGIRIWDIAITYSGTTYSNYSTTCCTELGQINGSVSVTGVNEGSATASWTWNGATTGIDKNILKVYKSDNSLFKTIDNISGSATSQSISGLDLCNDYYVTLTTVAKSGYCDGAEQGKSANFSVPGWGVFYDRGDETEGSLLSNVTKVTGDTKACLDENYIATFTANTGYKLPDGIAVYIAGGEATEGNENDYTWNKNTGTLTIFKTKIVEEVDVRIIGECITPNITADPVGAVYALNEGATPLSVTVEGAGTWCGYQWQSKVGEGAWTDIQNATNSSYTPSTASAGTTTLYRVKVTNTTSGCSAFAYSGAATVEVSALPVCAQPTFSPAAGTKLGTQSVTLGCETANATIYYTTNGNDPQEIAADLYDGSAIAVNQNTTIKAIAAKSGMTTSAVVSATYTIQCKAPTFSVDEGTYNVTKSVELASEYGTVYYTLDGSDPATDGVAYSEAIPVTVSTTVRAIAKKANCENSEEASAAYTLKCATPTFSIDAGTHTGVQNVELACATDGAAIHYTTNGNTPTGSSPTYSSAIAVSSAQTIKAIATKDGWSNSDVAEAAYTIQYTVTWKVGGVPLSDARLTNVDVLVNAGGKVSKFPSVTNDELSTCIPEHCTFMGWSASEHKTPSNDAPSDLFSSTDGTIPTVSANATYYAVFAEVVAGDDEWVETPLANLTSSDVFVMGSSSYAMPNNNGTASAPGLVSITVQSSKITSTVTDAMKWNVSGNATNGYTFYPNGDNETWLYCSTTANSGSNDNVRVGTGNRKVWELNSSGYLITKDNHVNRYLSIYSSQDFRAYANTDNGVFVIIFYKKTSTGSISNYQTGCCVAPANALSITGLTTVALDNTLTLSTQGGNGGDVTWSVTNGTGSATISDAGVLSPLNVGTVTVKAHQDETNGKCEQNPTVEITIVAATVHVTGVDVTPATAALLPGETIQLIAVVSPIDATDKSIKSWGSGTTTTATVSASGLVTAVAKGTSTVTATTNDGDFTDNCAVTVHGLTILKQDETGATISAEGVEASATGKSLSASAGESKYVFKGWSYQTASGMTGFADATNASTTMTGTPNNDVVVIAEFYKPRVIKWNVNNDDTFAETTVAYGGSISSVPAVTSGLACASTFIGWTDAAHNNGETPTDDIEDYEDALYNDAVDFPTNITEATTTYYAVFANASGKAGYFYIGDEGELEEGKIYIFVNSLSGDALGNAKALEATTLPPVNNSSKGKAADVTITSEPGVKYISTFNDDLEFECKSYNSETYAANLEVVASNYYEYLYIHGGGVGYRTDANQAFYTAHKLYGQTGGGSPRYLQYNSSEDKFEITADVTNMYAFVKQTTSYAGYVTICDMTKAKLTYVTPGGVPGCAETEVIFTKGEPVTICSTQPTPPTGYEFKEWNTATDGSGDAYTEGATIPAAKTEESVTLTAQWTPVTYNIIYHLDGGTNGANPDTYTIETADIELVAATRDHDRFEGWFTDNGVWENQVTTIALGSHENIELYAKWTPRYEIQFKAANVTVGTIWRAADEELNALVAGQGSEPSVTAPSLCGKMFAGWTKNQIEDIVEDAPADFMEEAIGTVNNNTIFYAVWADATPTTFTKVCDWEAASIPVEWKVSASIERTINQGYDGTYGGRINTNHTYVQFNHKVNATEFSFALRRTSNNTNGTVYIETSTDNSNWTAAETYEMSAFEESYTVKTKTFDGLSKLYVRFHCSQTTAVRYVDNVTIKYNNYAFTNYTTACHVTAASEQTVNVEESNTISSLTVKQDGTVNLGANLTVTDFTIEAMEGHSGQVLNPNNLQVNGNAYYDLTLNTSGTMDNSLWYAFAVPFQVDAATGIQRLSNDGVTSPAQFNGHYVLLKYNSAAYASAGEGWEYMTAGETLMPGKFYMIALNSNAYNRVRMTKKAGTTLNNKADLSLTLVGTGEHANWNALANNALAYANVNATGANASLKVQVYNSATNNYTPFEYNKVTFTVGTPFFLQAAEAGTMSVNIAASNNETVKAPQREAVATEEFQIRLGENTESYYDILYVSASEEALNEYQIGHDLAKAGVSKTVPQMYVPAYGAKLCDAEFPLENNEATFPLTFTAPIAGTYQLYVAEAAQDAELYLMQNNSIVWNLTLSPYEIALPQGTTEGYSLLLKAKVPSVVTGVDQIDAKAGVQKVIIDEHVYILRGGQMYDVNGKMVK